MAEASELVFQENYFNPFCKCGSGWIQHCRNKNCRWVRCGNDKHTSMLDIKNHRYWGTSTGGSMVEITA